MGAESDLSILLDDKGFAPAKQADRPACISAFFPKLRPHEGTMLFAVSNDKAGLADFAVGNDRFYSGRFRAACRIVLRDVHKTTPNAVLQKQVARA